MLKIVTPELQMEAVIRSTLASYSGKLLTPQALEDLTKILMDTMRYLDKKSVL